MFVRYSPLQYSILAIRYSQIVIFFLYYIVYLFQYAFKGVKGSETLEVRIGGVTLSTLPCDGSNPKQMQSHNYSTGRKTDRFEIHGNGMEPSDAHCFR